jgi:ADP-ribose pyrophosphatase
MGDDSGWITRRSRTLVETAWIRLHRDEVELPSGAEITYTWLHHDGYVVVVPLTDDGRVVMERIHRHPIGRSLLECPSGGLDGEDPITAGRRELEEETGYRATSWTHLGRYYGASGHSDERFDVVVARGLSNDGELSRESTEQIELELIPLDRLREMALSSELEDAPSALAILLTLAREGAA